MALFYNGPAEGNQSTIDKTTDSRQIKLEYAISKALREEREETPLTDLAQSRSIPKHTGKRIVIYDVFPILDDRNTSDEGLDANGAVTKYGNLYGSSKDVGTILGKMPHLTEKGGRVNGVTLTRKLIEGNITRQGIFIEFSDESLDFDSDTELFSHITRELLNAAHKIYEDNLQIDILTSANTKVFGGGIATKMEEMKGERYSVAGIEVPADEVTYDDIIRLEEVLTDKKASKTTKILTGSTNTDTRTIGAQRVLIVAPPVKRVLARMRDAFGNPAFIEVHKYASQTTPLKGEIGAVGGFRVVEVRDFKVYEGAGAPANENEGYRTTIAKGQERYDVYPMLCVPSDTFSTIQFRSSTGKPKFNMVVKQPGSASADRNNPFGTMGFASLQWWYGTIVFRPEQIGVLYTVAPV